MTTIFRKNGVKNMTKWHIYEQKKKELEKKLAAGEISVTEYKIARLKLPKECGV